ncbi:MAG: 3'-5' exonuclease [Bdellovibrionaceae bacterium]|nr:3'-5' exonuclease [Pseudobdellovibrionaceae bacterium]MBX3032581.1 3'-5' exonuclease [Pseudobdellovibrionaceae bacterium]
MNLDLPWNEYTYTAFDTETSGAWPVGCDVVEFGAVKWFQGQEIGRLQFLLKPRRPMSAFIIGIHGITNEMVADAPAMPGKIREIAEFFKGTVPMAHHAPFDMGFIAVDFEANQVGFPVEPVLCTSLLARKLIHGVENHKLQTLVKFLGVDGGSAHRALDDARSCLAVGVKCMQTMGEKATLRDVIAMQGKNLRWADYTVLHNNNATIRAVVEATRAGVPLEFLYDKATTPRQAVPLGVVRNPDGDFMQAYCLRDRSKKRFYLGKMREAVVIPGKPWEIPQD